MLSTIITEIKNLNPSKAIRKETLPVKILKHKYIFMCYLIILLPVLLLANFHKN